MSEYILRLHKYIAGTCVEGPGKRLAIWVQGCGIHCDGCAEKQTWNPQGGYDMACETLLGILDTYTDIKGVTILGGEPMEQAKSLSYFLEGVKSRGKNTIVFTGYQYKELISRKQPEIEFVLKNTDLLIDGKYERTRVEDERPWVGSKNQQFHFLSDKLKFLQGTLLNYKNKMEIRILRDGAVEMNGMWKL